MRFQLKSFIAFTLFTIGSNLYISPFAQAANFKTNFTPEKYNFQEDILLNSITQNQNTFDNFSLVQSAEILYNTPITGVQPGSSSIPGPGNNNTGSASTEKGDNATFPVPVSGLKNPTNNEIAAFFSNRNLNNILDTEDIGASKINLFFDSYIQQDNTGLDNLFFWERGMNSDLGVHAIDSTGKLLGNFLKLSRNEQQSAGYAIDTTEIGGSQQVGYWGVNLSQLGVDSLSGIQVIAKSKANGDLEDYNGPDYKVVARKTTRRVPEPGTVLGLGIIAGTIGLLRRRRLAGV
jgi:PEP-CTERM motif